MTKTDPAAKPSAFRTLPFMGVIRVNNAAMLAGWKMGDPAWANLGQGQPEVGEIEGAPARFKKLSIEIGDHGYGPVEGIPELREAVANHYNRLYRKGNKSLYTAANVMIAPGGRAALTRIGAALNNITLGYFTPDYTAYEDLLVTFSRIKPSWIELKPEDGFRISLEDLETRVEADGISALLLSNPCNPTGAVVSGRQLAAWCDMARRRNCTILFDEFYSHFSFADGRVRPPISAAQCVRDVNTDPIVIIDGLTKCFRYPGWRVGWVLASEAVIQSLTAAGSFLDGGPSRPIQRAAVDVLEPTRADQETQAMAQEFAAKQLITATSLRTMGIEIPGKPEGTFYIFGDVSRLPGPLSNGVSFMNEAFKHKVLTVPGEFFDVNPNKTRSGDSPLAGFVRFSFGPPRTTLEPGLKRLAEMVAKFS